jgi:hypothetical protein
MSMPAFGQFIGPSTTQTPYLVPTAPGVEVISIASNGNDSVAGFRRLHSPLSVSSRCSADVRRK